MRRALTTTILLILLGTAASARADVFVDLYTMGPGDDVFSAFGHGALCVFDEDSPAGACYNYGTADFEHPVDLGWTFLRGQARFWVVRTQLAHMMERYAEEDRTVWRQRLPLTTEQAQKLAALLANDLEPENRTYVYHHYKENCSTRLRDHIDQVTGALSADKNEIYGPTYRELSRRGFVGDPLLLAVSEIALGRLADIPTTTWQAMFLPSVLRVEVERRLGVHPELVYQRHGEAPHGSTRMGQALFYGVALLLAFLFALAGATRWRWFGRIALIVTGLTLGLLGVLVDVLCTASIMPELRRNEILLVFLPTDLLLIFLGGRALIGYLQARLVLVAAVVVGMLAGVLVQPLAAPLALVGVPLLVALAQAMSVRGRDRKGT